MVRAIPGDPAQLLLGQQATQEQVQQVRQNMGLDKPVIVQYGIFLVDALRGDLGDSIVTGRPVTTELLARFPATLELTLFAMLVAVLVGVPVGVISAVKQYSWLDKLTSVLALTGISMPIFWLAMILIVIFFVNLGWLPFPGRLSTGYAVTSITGLVLVDSLLTLNFGVLGRPQTPHHARHSPRDHPDGGGDAHDPLQHARGDGRGLRAHRARQGGRPVAGDLQARPQKRYAADCDGDRAPGGPPDGRGGHHGDHLLLAGGRPDSLRVGESPRLRYDPGRRALRGDALRAGKPPRRHPLRGARP